MAGLLVALIITGDCCLRRSLAARYRILLLSGATQAASNAAVALERRTLRVQGRRKFTGPTSRIEGALAQTLALWVEEWIQSVPFPGPSLRENFEP